MLSLINWFFNRSRINTDLYGEIKQRQNFCGAKIIYVEKNLIAAKCKFPYIREKDFFRIRNSYDVVVIYESDEYTTTGVLKSIDFSFERQGFILKFKTDSKIYELLETEVKRLKDEPG